MTCGELEKDNRVESDICGSHSCGPRMHIIYDVAWVKQCEGTTRLRNDGNDLPVNTIFHPKNTNSWSETKITSYISTWVDLWNTK
jgi:hypothetical protein